MSDIAAVVGATYRLKPRCPYCESISILSLDPPTYGHTNPPELRAPVGCGACGRGWTEVYRLQGIITVTTEGRS